MCAVMEWSVRVTIYLFRQSSSLYFTSKLAVSGFSFSRNLCRRARAMDGFPITFHGHTYDINKFLKDHPGGANTLKNFKGRSILQAMEKFGHSASAYHMLKDFKVSEDVNLTGGVSASGRIITKEDGLRNSEEIAFLEELENRLDYSKPILRQLHVIAPHYSRWVNSAVYRRCRLFENHALESLTYTPWFIVPLVWIPVILYLGYTEFLEHVSCGDACTPVHISTFQFMYHLALGLFIWTILEYTLHRWVFHLNPGSSLLMIKFHFLIHGLHHKMPFDGLRQVFPPVPALGITCALYAPLRMLLAYPTIKLAGGLFGYLVYDMIHYYVHHGSPKDGSYLYTMKRYHSNHHFVNHDKAFGISSTFWDHVFNTFVRLRKLGFSLKW